MLDKYGAGQDPYCYPDTQVLRNSLGIKDDSTLTQAERELSELSADAIDFALPPYNLAYLKSLHKRLFSDLYDWAGELRTVDISKSTTHFCTVSRIEPEANKLFDALARANWFEGMSRPALISACSELFGDLNMVHPFREGNGRSQRILFEHLIVNAGYEIDWWGIEMNQWIQANIDAVVCDYRAMGTVFERCIGQPLQ